MTDILRVSDTLSLQEAVATANNTPEDEIIELESGQTYEISSELDIASTGGTLTIRGVGEENAIINANENSRVIHVNSDDDYEASLVLENITLTGGRTSFDLSEDTDGAGIFIDNRATVELTNCVITGNATSSDDVGGGIFNDGYLTLTDCIVSNNVAGQGGGIYTSYGNTTIIDSTITNNSAVEMAASTTIGFGGGVSHRGAGTTEINNSTVSENSANSSGGGVHIDDGFGSDSVTGSLRIVDSTISGNDAPSGGGILSREVESSVVENTIIENNTADFGGGVFNAGGVYSNTMVVENSTIQNNLARGDGGGIYSDDDLRIRNSTISGNQANDDGGGVYVDYASVRIYDSLVDGNSAEGNGGGLYDVDIVRGTTISNNIANGSGGGLHANLGLVVDSTISGNIAAGDGGGVFADGSNFEYATLVLANSTISSNQANANGGGINVDTAYYTAGLIGVNLTITDNLADRNNDGGGDGGGINNSRGFVSLGNSILEGNFDTPENSGEGTINPNISGDAAGDASNIVGDLTGLGEGQNLGQGSDITGVAPLLGELQDNGGEIATHALLSGSPAINAGNNANILQETFFDIDNDPEVETFDFNGDGDFDDALEFDQRGEGFSRVAGETVDIGAFELQDGEEIEPNPEPTPGEEPNPEPNPEPSPEPESGEEPEPSPEPSPETTPEPNPDNPDNPDESQSTIELFRFRNTSFDTGTYVFVGEEEKNDILADENLNNTFSLDGEQEDGTVIPAFVASTTPGDDLIAFYRLKNLDTEGTFLFVAQQEYDGIFAEDSEQRDKWEREGLDEAGEDIPEFYLYDGSVEQGTEFNRFQNTQNNTFLYAGEAETAAIESDDNLSNLFTNQGVAFKSLS